MIGVVLIMNFMKMVSDMVDGAYAAWAKRVLTKLMILFLAHVGVTWDAQQSTDCTYLFFYFTCNPSQSMLMGPTSADCPSCCRFSLWKVVDG